MEDLVCPLAASQHLLAVLLLNPLHLQDYQLLTLLVHFTEQYKLRELPLILSRMEAES